MVIIVDDNTDVWHNLPNVLQVKPFVYFMNVGDINDPKTRSEKPSISQNYVTAVSSDSSDYLMELSATLLKIHDNYFSEFNDNMLQSPHFDAQKIAYKCSTSIVMNKMRQSILAGVHLVFDQNAFAELEILRFADLAQRFGARAFGQNFDNPSEVDDSSFSDNPPSHSISHCLTNKKLFELKNCILYY